MGCKNNIQRQLQEAHGQSVNVILDASRSKMHPDEMLRRAEYRRCALGQTCKKPNIMV